jgi:hypothetical protein
MSVFVEKLHLNGSTEGLAYLLPGQYALHFTQNEKGRTHDSVIVACRRDDTGLDIYAGPKLELVPGEKAKKHAYLRSFQTEENRIGDKTAEKRQSLPMLDSYEGHFSLLTRHVAVFLPN